jgi:hypothetical protein
MLCYSAIELGSIGCPLAPVGLGDITCPGGCGIERPGSAAGLSVLASGVWGVPGAAGVSSMSVMPS